MVKVKKFYITTAIDYVNAEPHVGHAYQKIVADSLARWHKLNGEKVFFLTGTDEHGQKISRSAKKENISEKEFVDKMSKNFENAWKLLNVDPDRFIRTTDKDHKEFVQKFVEKVKKDIYKGKYLGNYCVDCEAYVTEKDLVNEECPYHLGKKIEKIEEDTYYFKLSKYQDKLLKWYKTHPESVLPATRKNEIISFVKEGLDDLSITRTNFSWGIPFPLDKKHVIYVWFDALLNYLSGAGKKQEFWPAEAHLLGKDNGRFHAVIWPAMLMSAGYELPKTVFIHGFLTFNGKKISKSLGNVISPVYLANKYGTDSVRYFILRQIPFAEGDDGDFSESALVDRHNNELANKLGNLVSRVSALAEQNGIQSCDNKLAKKLKLKEIEKNFENFEVDKVLNLIFEFIDACNEYVQEKKPWETKDKKVLFELADSIKKIAILLWPFIPTTSEKIAKHFDFKINYKELKEPLKIKNIKKAEILFKKIEIKTSESKINKPVTPNKIEGIISMGTIGYNEWEKVELRVGEIDEVEDIKGADKLYKLTVSLGKEIRTICAGIKQFYSKEDLKGKKCIVFVNLAPRVMKGITSEGMILAAVNEDESKVVLIAPEEDIEVGSKIR
ncbi:MAG: methionine--tRNA ligase [Nanoarchaeota archaeon]|nr:methionine--tRNA ligase [Nanoarchaeota archaeon]